MRPLLFVAAHGRLFSININALVVLRSHAWPPAIALQVFNSVRVRSHCVQTLVQGSPRQQIHVLIASECVHYLIR
jgi:hypothetical protein